MAKEVKMMIPVNKKLHLKLKKIALMNRITLQQLVENALKEAIK